MSTNINCPLRNSVMCDRVAIMGKLLSTRWSYGDYFSSLHDLDLELPVYNFQMILLLINSLPNDPDFLTTLKKKAVENVVGKGEKAGSQHFLLFPKCFLPIPKRSSFILSSANDFNLDQSKNLSLDKELRRTNEPNYFEIHTQI